METDGEKLNISELLTENWDSPVIITSLVQLLDTFFSGRKKTAGISLGGSDSESERSNPAKPDAKGKFASEKGNTDTEKRVRERAGAGTSARRLRLQIRLQTGNRTATTAAAADRTKNCSVVRARTLYKKHGEFAEDD